VQNEDDAFYTFSIIEEIGCNIHLFYPFTDLGIAIDPEYTIRLRGVYLKDKLIFPMKDVG
jgi:hypothetical protein